MSGGMLLYVVGERDSISVTDILRRFIGWPGGHIYMVIVSLTPTTSTHSLYTS